MDGAYDVNVYFIPVLKEQMLPWNQLWNRVSWKRSAGFVAAYIILWKWFVRCPGKIVYDKDNIPCFFLLDKQGKVIYKTNGAYTDEKYDELDEKIE